MVVKGIIKLITTSIPSGAVIPPHEIQLTDDISGGIAEPEFQLGFRSSVSIPFNDLWSGSATTIPIPPQPGGQQMQLQSTDVADAAAGTGVQKIMVHYLDSSGTEQQEVVIMNGTTAVTTLATNIRFVNELHSYAVGSNNFAVGTITITPVGTPATVYNQIDPNNNIDLSTQFMVPAGKLFVISSFSGTGASTVSGRPADIRLCSTDDDGLLLATNIFIADDSILVLNSGLQKSLEIPKFVPALSIVKMIVYDSTPGEDISGTYKGVLVPAPT